MIPEKRPMRSRMVRVAVLAAACGAAALAAAQTEQVNAVIDEQVKAEQASLESQQRIGRLDDESSRMLAEYRQIVAEADGLASYNDQLAVQVKSQDGELAAMTRQLEEIATTSREVLPMMTRMVDTLERFVALDVPFLPDERADRVAGLKGMMDRADVSISEKYRRIVEAYQIEIEYGRTIEAYQGRVDGKTVEFLRAGRVSLMYQTLDARETGYWDNTERVWKVDRRYREAMQEGLKIAKKQAAPDFIGIAVPAPVEVGS